MAPAGHRRGAGGHYLYAYRCLYGRIDRNAVATCAALPISAALIYYAAARSAWLALARGGIHWRDTFYPLAQLRAQSGSG